MSKLYFAYGSNLWLEQMKERCPNHRLIGNGVLNGYRWIISKRGYANIIKSTPDEVHGVVYEIAKSDEDTLDIKEGVNEGLYRKETLSVDVNGKNQSCLVYVDPVIQEGNSKEEYIERINKGVKDAKLSPEYVRRYIRVFIPESSDGVEDEMSETDKIEGSSLNITAGNGARLKALFPTIFTETKNDKGELIESVDFEKLKAELGTFTDLFEARRERYGMDWPGKKDALRLIQTPSAATLKPCREESVNFDNTENLFVEGDNLEVLKLLQKSYYGKVKMIYIDPPYNTGKEFIYPDNYSESLETYLQYAGLIDAEGKKFATNTTNEGRFHTKWLNMMYPRLYLARNLLRDDGVIFISIDDNEMKNLRALCDELFGEENFVGVFPWRSRTAKADVPFGVSIDVEWVLTFAKTGNFVAGRAGERKYYKSDDYEDRWRLQDLTKNTTKNERPNSYFTMINPRNGDKYPAGETRTWSITTDTFDDYYKRGKIVFPGDYDFLNIKRPAFRVFEKEDKEKALKKYGSEDVKMSLSTYLPEKEVGRTEHGTKEIRDLFESQVFPFPKPSSLIKYFIENISDEEALILDFFSGSATTAHAVLALNKEDGGNRKFIMVQLPEPCSEESEAFRAGYKTIADIGKERIRRVITRLNDENSESLPYEGASIQDRGFKVLKLDKSNFKQWQKLAPDAKPEEIEKQLSLHIDHIDNKATPEDLLFEILVKAGFIPTEKVQFITLADIPVFSIADGGLLICLADTVTKELINAVAEAEPMQFICLDRAFGGNDQLKANAVQTFAARNMGREKANQIVFRTV